MPIRQRIARHLGEAVSCPQPATSGSISSSSLPPVAPLLKKRAPFPSSLLSNKPGVNKKAVFKLRTELNGKVIGSKMIEEVPKPGSLDRARAQSEALNKNNNDKRKREAPDEVRPQSFYGGGGRAAEQDAGGSPPKKRKVAEAAKAVSNKRKRETLDEEVSPDASGNAAEQDAGERTETSATTKKRKLTGHSEPTAHSAVEPAGKAPLQSQAPAETTALPPPVKPASSTKARAKAKAKAPVKAPAQHRNNTKSSTAKPKMDAASFLSAPCRRSSRLTQTPLDQLSPEQKYLSYYDVTLTNEDIKALRTDWLTDINISFWEEWLEREILPKYPQARIVLLRPTMTMILTKERKMEQVKKALPEFRNVTHIFVPITDATSAQAEGGTHWSLLLVSTIDGVAFHYDSLGNANYKEGYEATYCLSKVLGIPLRFQNIEDCPQQENGNDCGVFVCILMRHLLVKRLLNANAREKVSMSMANMMIDAGGGRKEMMKIIENLRREGERRRSTSPFSLHKPSPPRID